MLVHVASDGGLADSASLRHWIEMSGELRQGISLAPVHPAPRGEMGPSLDVVDIVLSNALSLGSLLATIAAWRSTRPRNPDITIRHRETTITMTGERPDDIDQIVKALNGAEPDRDCGTR
ncbi:effector-associated constant component EACC1 [Krasilnikovia sp. M28-CT-15]|uniref:effector-associated constant component EACC1 n=1 Tax=Krasilnikovia sp. M28-CT-15 TaxID=3373540 RepID=UPI00387760EA